VIGTQPVRLGFSGPYGPRHRSFSLSVDRKRTCTLVRNKSHLNKVIFLVITLPMSSEKRYRPCTQLVGPGFSGPYGLGAGHFLDWLTVHVPVHTYALVKVKSDVHCMFHTKYNVCIDILRYVHCIYVQIQYPII